MRACRREQTCPRHHRLTLTAAAGIASLLALSGMSAGERGRNEKPTADQQREGETAEDREDALPAIGRLGVGGGSLRR
jgi:hypothetical protein